MKASKNPNPLVEGKKLGWVSSMSRAAMMLGTTREFLRKIKVQGCPAWDQKNRIDLDVLSEWISSHPEELQVAQSETASKEALEKRRLLAQAETIEHRLAVKRGEYVLKSLVAEHLTRYGAEVKNILRQKENELPALIPGGDPVEIRALFRTHISDSMLAGFRQHFDTWTI